MNITEYNWQTK